ncbi:hypothetical protein KIL84_021688 [Mauremys mutica]|uniref:Uncharacterized protein n=1 Tax=Mauremys mutica TaxID=74926 RepID=A0A9D4AZ90_9SAUR|nr:hypothetical protein KIL84_021688 [Mauremys mutica]
MDTGGGGGASELNYSSQKPLGGPAEEPIRTSPLAGPTLKSRVSEAFRSFPRRSPAEYGLEAARSDLTWYLCLGWDRALRCWNHSDMSLALFTRFPHRVRSWCLCPGDCGGVRQESLAKWKRLMLPRGTNGLASQFCHLAEHDGVSQGAGTRERPMDGQNASGTELRNLSWDWTVPFNFQTLLKAVFLLPTENIVLHREEEFSYLRLSVLRLQALQGRAHPFSCV